MIKVFTCIRYQGVIIYTGEPLAVVYSYRHPVGKGNPAIVEEMHWINTYNIYILLTL